MSDSTQQYISKPVTPTVYALDGSVYSIEVGGETLLFKKPLFDELFVPLDIPAIEQQLDEIIWRNAFTTFIDSDSDEQQAEIDKAVGDILGVFGLENKETE